MNVDQFIRDYPQNALQDAILDSPSARELICRQLHPTPDAKYLPLLREMLTKEACYRADDTNDGEYFENLYWVGLFLYQIGTLHDVLPMWKAKQINMDTGCGFDVQFLVGRGVSETLSFLKDCSKPGSAQAYDYINCCKATGDFDNLEQWLAERIEYYSGMAG